MFLKTLRKKLKSDRGGSSLISFILLTPLFLGLVITAFDTSFYFANRGQVEAVTRDAARTIAIFGGNGDLAQATTIEKTYGQNRAAACSVARANAAPQKELWTSVNKSSYTPTECNVLYALVTNGGLVSVSMDSTAGDGVKCGPRTAANVGTRTYCTVKYTYDGLPGAPMGFIQIRQADGSTGGLLSHNVVTKSSESEVMLPTMVNR